MASVKALVTIKWEGKERPPGSILHGFDLDEARKLSRFVQIMDGDEAPALEIDAEAPGEPEEGHPAAVGVDTPPGGTPAQAPGGEASRVAEIMAALDLLDEVDWTVTGRPKAPALKSILGFKATVAEIDAALKLREAL